MLLATKRLILRPIKLDDVTAIQKYAEKPNVVRFMEWGPNTIEQTKSFINLVVQKNKETPRLSFDFLATRKKTKEVIGACGIYFKDEKEPPTLGWVFDDTYWNEGYGTEVAARLLAFGFLTLNVPVIHAEAIYDNKASWKIMEKLGMRQVDTYKKSVKNKEYVFVMYELTKLEYTLLNHKTYL
ncbi:MAG TPA: GNAT family N-acetyltransferase [Bacilli bacterium]|nr:GNAT family N-acetyltransferase [Bacilli bacterium]